MRVMFRNSQRLLSIDASSVTRLAEYVLKRQGAREGELSISFVRDTEIRKLYKRYFGADRATDVIAFPMGEGEFSEINPEILGDVVISVEQAVRYSKDHRSNVFKELSLYLIHGMLHLMGYNDINLNEKRKMIKKQNSLLREAVRKDLLIKGKGR